MPLTRNYMQGKMLVVIILWSREVIKIAIKIYKDIDIDFEHNVQLKKSWQQWKTLNMDSRSIFFPIFKEFAEHHLMKLSGGACKLYIFLGLVGSRTGESWYSIKRMAENMNVSARSIDNYLQELEDVGLIVRERSNSSSTTYLLPYSLNIHPIKPTTEKTLNEILQTAIAKAQVKESIAGSIYRIFHLFQWIGENQSGCIQGVVVTTKKSYPKGPDQYNAFVYVDHFSNPDYVLDTPHISGVRRFNSNISIPGIEVIGIAIDEEDKLSLVSNQKDALSQLCKAPIEHLQEFQMVNFVPQANRTST